MTRLLLDAGVLVAGLNRRLQLSELSDGDDVALPAVVVAEFLAAETPAGDRARRATRLAFLEDVLEVVPVENYDRNVAQHHAELMGRAQRLGGTFGAHDLIVAATAVATRRVVVTTDADGRLDELPGVTVRLISTRAGGGSL